MRGPAHITLLLAMALTISACGGDEEDTETAAAETTAAETTALEQDTDATSESQAAPVETEDGDDAAAESASAPDAAAASETAPTTDVPAVVDTIPGAIDPPLAELGEFMLLDGSGPAFIYENGDGDYLTVDSQTLGSPYEDLVSEISTDNVEAGAGSCGLNPGGTSAVCYQRTDDGVLTMTANADLLDALAQFASEYAVAASS